MDSKLIECVCPIYPSVSYFSPRKKNKKASFALVTTDTFYELQDIWKGFDNPSEHWTPQRTYKTKDS